MTEKEWLGATDARRLVGLSAGEVTGRKFRLFMVAWCRHNWDRITLPVVKEAAELAERFADGKASKKQLELLFEECRSILYGTPLRYLLWPDSSQMADCVDQFCLNDLHYSPYRTDDRGDSYQAAQTVKAAFFRDIVGNPFRSVAFPAVWRTDTVGALARQMYESREFSPMPILADALEDTGCSHESILSHCRGDGPHVRGCWVVDLILGKS
ncbi:MAG TPA: hypothetical protein VH092_21870 [Urbifossiella sp.]|jgi:hypothetical protein|nr:hypothetical protein [Urbifossiella sp.]